MPTPSQGPALGAKEPLPILRESRMLLRIGPNRQEKLPFTGSGSTIERVRANSSNQEKRVSKNKHSFFDPRGWSFFPCPALREALRMPRSPLPALAVFLRETRQCSPAGQGLTEATPPNPAWTAPWSPLSIHHPKRTASAPQPAAAARP